MDAFTLVVFGITSNLVQIKLIPALYDLHEKGLVSEDLKIIGIARRDLSESAFRELIHDSLHTKNIHHDHSINEKLAHGLESHFQYLQGNFEDPSLYLKLKDILGNGNSLYYLATYPQLYARIFELLKKSSLNQSRNGWTRLILEKPIGHDKNSAKALNHLLHKTFKEEQIFRLDHYLGKETLQNILAFRFGNEIFEHIVNNKHLDHIQITAAEDIGIGKRGGYYDKVGALKDVGQNHELQLATIATMEPPKILNNHEVTKERVKILKKLTPDPSKLIFGQYNGYLYEENVQPDSNTETFFALRTEIKNNRFQGVPIYIRAGKKLARYATEINLVFQSPHNDLFSRLELGKMPNVLTYRIFPNEGIGLQILTKSPSHEWRLDIDHMIYKYDQKGASIPDAYEKLLYDCLKGDQTFFNDPPEIEAQWDFVDSLTLSPPKLCSYEPGSWGPKEADELIEKDGRKWLEPSENF